MLVIKRFQYFPRSIIEIWPELETHKHHPIMLEPKIALKYPSALYFFVNKNNRTLHKAILMGLEKSISDGSFDKIFNLYYQTSIALSNLKGRKLITLVNPFIPDTLPLKRQELWLKN